MPNRVNQLENLLCCLYYPLKAFVISDGSSKSDLPVSDSVFGINYEAISDSNYGADSGVDSGSNSGVDSKSGIDSGIGSGVDSKSGIDSGSALES